LNVLLSPRLHKVLRDLRTERGRVALMVTAITASLIAVGSVLGGYCILTREMARNYLGTRPASASLELAGPVDDALVEAVRTLPSVADAEAGEIVLARARVGPDYRPLLLFVVDDFQHMRLNTFRREHGAWPPARGTMLIERTAAQVLQASEGDTVRIKTPHGSAKAVGISGIVHDAGLAPAWQEAEGYGYITKDTLAELGEPGTLGQLRVLFRGAPEQAAIDRAVNELTRWLVARGHTVIEARVPPPARHPHQTQMYGVLYLMMTFSVLALLLSAVLVASSLAAMLARQVREIGIMKTVGARSAQIASLYVLMVSLIGLGAVALALPLGVLGARAFAAMSAKLLNLELVNLAIPAWAFALQAAAGLIVPLLVASIPIARASGSTIRATIDQHGVVASVREPRRRLQTSGRLSRRIALAMRNAVRRRTRLLLTLVLLAIGGAMFMTALNVLRGWERIVARVYENRSYDVEVRLDAPASVVERLRALPEVKKVESWGYTRSAFSRPNQVDVVRTYPDGSHGSLVMMGPPATTELIRFPLLAGRWLLPSDRDAVVLNHMALAQAPDTKVGGKIALSLEGRPTTWTVVGIVEEVGSPGVAYVTDAAFAQAADRKDRVRLLRLQTRAQSADERVQSIRAIEHALDAPDVRVETVIPLAVLRTAMGDHVLVLIRMLLAMAALLGLVGALGLSSTISTSVVERTREIGVMKTLGATPADVSRLFVVEGLFVAALSWPVALLLSGPLTAQVGQTVGMLSFRLRLPFVMSVAAAAGWLALILLVALLASLFPARRAARLTVRDALTRL
jgi:putative ABC transport system permease protein